MLPSYLLSLREGLEAALILGVLLGALDKIRRADLKPALWAGAFAAIVFSLLSAALLTALGLKLEGKAEEIFEGSAMLLAAGVLTWMIFWMNAQAKNLKAELEGGVYQAASASGGRALFGLAFIAIAREGIELALFLTAAFFAASSNANAPILTVSGAALGLGAAVLLGWSLLASTARLNLKKFFQVTSVLLVLFAAGLTAHGVHEFNEAGWIPAVVEHLWDVNALIDEKSFFGQMLSALFGYNGNPSLTEVAAYLAYLGGAAWLFARPTTSAESSAAQRA